MTMVKHSPEPWKKGTHGIEDSNYESVVLDLSDTDLDCGWSEPASEVDLDRIVTCINALAGIEDPEAFVEAARKGNTWPSLGL